MTTKVVEASEECLKDRHEKLFEMLLEAIPSSVLLIDRDMRIATANQNFLQKSRRLRNETIGRKLGDLLPAAIIEYMDISSSRSAGLRKREGNTGRATDLQGSWYSDDNLLLQHSPILVEGPCRERHPLDGRCHRAGSFKRRSTEGGTSPGQCG